MIILIIIDPNVLEKNEAINIEIQATRVQETKLIINKYIKFSSKAIFKNLLINIYIITNTKAYITDIKKSYIS